MLGEDNLIELVNIWKKYETVQVLRGISLAVKGGEFISIRGKSGAGKSTLLKIIGLLEEPDGGKIKIFGKYVGELSDSEKSDIRLHYIGFVFQFFNLIPSLTVLENIELPLALAGFSKQRRREKALELLKYFNLSSLAERLPGTLSGGERQRIAIIRALVNNPKVILADEPTSSLDEENSELLIRLLDKVNKEKKVTVVITSTDLNEKLPTSRDYLLKEGKLFLLKKA
jgi:putative ABC transport system ATP-binding protein